MRFRLASALVALTLILSPLPAFAAESTFLGPIVPPECNCEAGADKVSSAADWGCILQTIQNGMNFIVVAALFLLIIYIAYAGALFVFTPANPANRETARAMIRNAIFGLLVAMAAWLLVDFVMKVLYNPDVQIAGKELGPWNEILKGGADQLCLKVAANPPPLPGVKGGDPGPSTIAGDVPVSDSSITPYTTGPCSVANFTRDWGSEKVATTMSCIVKFESRCNDTAKNPSSTAGGRYQILLSYDDPAHNLNFPSCTAAAQSAGFRITGNLNCSTAFKGGKVNAGKETLAAACRAAQVNAACNTDAAKWLYAHGGYKHWLGDPKASSQRACVQKYGT